MKVSKSIKDKMRRIAKLHKEAGRLSNEVDDYFIEKGYDIEELRSGDGKSLEELEYGNDVTEEFCEWLENDYCI